MDKILLLGMNGLIWGLIIALIALGPAIIFGLLDIINLAHGDFFMVGTVLAWGNAAIDRQLLARIYRGASDRPHPRRAHPADGDSADAQRGCTFDRGDLRPVADPPGDCAHHLWANAGPHPAADCADHHHVRRRL